MSTLVSNLKHALTFVGHTLHYLSGSGSWKLRSVGRLLLESAISSLGESSVTGRGIEVIR